MRVRDSVPRTKPKSVYSKRPPLLERYELREVAGRTEDNYSKIANNVSTIKDSLLAGESKLVADVHLNPSVTPTKIAQSPPHPNPRMVVIVVTNPEIKASQY